MKKIALTFLILIVVAGAIFFYVRSTPDSIPLKAGSQQDTSVDTDSSRDTFEYFLSGLGETDMENLQRNFQAFNQQQPGVDQINEDLFQQYIDYKNYLQTLENGLNEEGLEQYSLAREDLLRLHEKLLAAQLKFFTPEQQQELFGEENRLRELTLKKLELKQQVQSQEEFDQLWQQELSPEELESYNNASLIGKLNQTRDMDEQEQFITRETLVGTEAAERLAELDRKRADFNSKLDDYFVQRQQILSDSSSNEQDRNLAIKDLRYMTFTPSQLRRIKALESIHDSEQE